MTDTHQFTLKFCGGTGAATGANFLFKGPRQDNSPMPNGQHGSTFHILVDCGLEQGTREAEEFNRAPFPYDPSTIDILLVTHAHTDHIGRIPKLIHDGFTGKIYSTPETKKITSIMYEDALKLLTMEATRHGTEPLYSEVDVTKTLSIWHTIEYHTDFELHPGYSVYLKDAGHVLGSTMFELTAMDIETGLKRKIVFTGDLGNSPAPLLRDTEDIVDADYMLMESVYGDRNHEDRGLRLQKLQDIINENHKRGGVLLMPVFALEKTQELLYEINELIKDKKISPYPIYLDAPLAIKLTAVYEEMSKSFNSQAKQDMRHDDIFDFPGLHVSQSAEDSMAIAYMPSPKIIMAGSGMSSGGRIQHHEAHFLKDPKNTILFTGYQAVGTLGRLIRDGAPEVEIHGERIPVRARLETIDGYSSHKDMDHLVEFVSKTSDTLKKVFVAMGETKSSLFLVQRLRDYLGVHAVAPELGQEILLD
jgi:metallo-beta-lactamase family protein